MLLNPAKLSSRKREQRVIPSLVDRNLSKRRGLGGFERRLARLTCDGFSLPGRGMSAECWGGVFIRPPMTVCTEDWRDPAMIARSGHIPHSCVESTLPRRGRLVRAPALV